MTVYQLILAVAVMLSSFICNTLWAFYIKAISEDKLFKAAIFGELIVGAGAAVTYLYIKDLWMIIPMLLGGFIGTATSKLTRKLFIKDATVKKEA